MRQKFSWSKYESNSHHTSDLQCCCYCNVWADYHCNCIIMSIVVVSLWNHLPLWGKWKCWTSLSEAGWKHEGRMFPHLKSRQATLLLKKGGTYWFWFFLCDFKQKQQNHLGFSSHSLILTHLNVQDFTSVTESSTCQSQTCDTSPASRLPAENLS